MTQPGNAPKARSSHLTTDAVNKVSLKDSAFVVFEGESFRGRRPWAETQHVSLLTPEFLLCFSLSLFFPSLAHLSSSSSLTSPVPHPVVSVSVCSLCPPSCLCQFVSWCPPCSWFVFGFGFLLFWFELFSLHFVWALRFYFVFVLANHFVCLFLYFFILIKYSSPVVSHLSCLVSVCLHLGPKA